MGNPKDEEARFREDVEKESKVAVVKDKKSNLKDGAEHVKADENEFRAKNCPIKYDFLLFVYEYVSLLP